MNKITQYAAKAALGIGMLVSAYGCQVAPKKVAAPTLPAVSKPADKATRDAEKLNEQFSELNFNKLLGELQDMRDYAEGHFNGAVYSRHDEILDRNDPLLLTESIANKVNAILIDDANARANGSERLYSSNQFKVAQKVLEIADAYDNFLPIQIQSITRYNNGTTNNNQDDTFRTHAYLPKLDETGGVESDAQHNIVAKYALLNIVGVDPMDAALVEAFPTNTGKGTGFSPTVVARMTNYHVAKNSDGVQVIVYNPDTDNFRAGLQKGNIPVEYISSLPNGKGVHSLDAALQLYADNLNK